MNRLKTHLILNLEMRMKPNSINLYITKFQSCVIGCILWVLTTLSITKKQCETLQMSKMEVNINRSSKQNKSPYAWTHLQLMIKKIHSSGVGWVRLFSERKNLRFSNWTKYHVDLWSLDYWPPFYMDIHSALRCICEFESAYITNL